MNNGKKPNGVSKAMIELWFNKRQRLTNNESSGAAVPAKKSKDVYENCEDMSQRNQGANSLTGIAARGVKRRCFNI